MFNAITTILRSASKLVFVMMTLAVIIALFVDKITGEQFMLLAGMAFTFYFSNKGDAKEPFAGK